jgi:hypothetical protein
MRGFVVVFLLGLIICGCAFAQTEKQATPTLAPPASNPTVHTFAFTLPNSDTSAQKTPAHASPEWLPGLSLRPNSPKAPVNLVPHYYAYLLGGAPCFTMRTYTVRRESAKSDVTVPSGYAECVPASRLKFKNVAPVKAEPK